MAEQKTKPTTSSVEEFLASIGDPQKRSDSLSLVHVMGEITGEPAVMWGPSMVGFGQYHYRYASGHEGDTFVTGFSPRKTSLSLYLADDTALYQPLLDRLGKHTVGKGCLYVKRLSDVDPAVLREVLEASVARVRARTAQS